ncbi:MAG: argininosuccinate lyase [Thermoleophilia bacterium]|nr:argininosuccinate lyase [Thermoleophilia bacterium]
MTAEGKNEKFWSGRFVQPPHQLFEQLNASIGFDWRLAPYDLQGSVAHARMLSDIGVITNEEFEEIDRGLTEIMGEIAKGDFAFNISDEDIHTAVEKRLAGLIGAPAAKLHTARSRNDQVATAFCLYVRDQIGQHLTDVVVLLESLLKQAEPGMAVILPGYTHLQRAQPVLLAHHLLAYFEMFARDYLRLSQAFTSTQVSPLGAGALAGVNYPVNRDQVAAELGFQRPGFNSMDDVSSRDFAIDYMGAASMLGMHLSRLAAELINWSSEEFGFVEISDTFTSGSSIMPQKKNPDACELIRAKAARVAANQQGLMSIMSGLPLAYNKDMQEDKNYVFDTSDILLLTVPVMAEIVATLDFNSSRMWRAADESFALATDVADYLVGKGMAFRDAHRVAGQLVRKCIDQKRALSSMTADDLKPLAAEFGDDYQEVINIEASVERKNSYGGTSPVQVAGQLAKARERLEDMRTALAELEG